MSFSCETTIYWGQGGSKEPGAHRRAGDRDRKGMSRPPPPLGAKKADALNPGRPAHPWLCQHRGLSLRSSSPLSQPEETDAGLEEEGGGQAIGETEWQDGRRGAEGPSKIPPPTPSDTEGNNNAGVGGRRLGCEGRGGGGGCGHWGRGPRVHADPVHLGLPQAGSGRQRVPE